MRSCENCGWLEVNPSGAMFCGYSEERTWKDECCTAWKDKDESKTNADRIRSMSDEELAEWLDHHVSCARCPLYGKCISYKTCSENLQAWLKEEVADGV